MLFRRADLDRIAAGQITVAFRRWRRPTVRAGGTLVSRAGVLAIESVDTIDEAKITKTDARRAGRAGPDAIRAELAGRPGDTYRIRFALGGVDPRVELRERTDGIEEAIAALERIDARSAHGPWTRKMLELIAANPGVRAQDLAESVGREKLPFKADVRKLKAIGLTESLEVGYRLSRRGAALLRRL
ncbi:MAG: hypothetical protein QOG62_2294 [Thermoleophilaceae bacterium]|nr:hypothetical protein [Thermoleophilaceae bacterium]